MTTATLAPPPSPVATLPVEPEHRSIGHRLWRFATGLALIAITAGSIAGMVLVIHDRVGFSPVLSPSMVPAFSPGDLIITRSEPATAMRVGQIVALPIPGEAGQRYVHRIISITTKNGKPLVRTKGDANPLPEPYSLRVTSKDVPVVVASVPKMGRLSLITKRSTPRLILIALTLIFGAVAATRLFFGMTSRDEIEDTQ
jgi:signal peptidase